MSSCVSLVPTLMVPTCNICPVPWRQAVMPDEQAVKMIELEVRDPLARLDRLASLCLPGLRQPCGHSMARFARSASPYPLWIGLYARAAGS